VSVAILWHDNAGAVVSAVFDVDEQETHDLQNVVTEHPVEDGQDVTDHVRPALDRFTIQGYVSDTPLYGNPGVVGAASFVEIELQIPDYPLQLSESGLISAGIGAIGNALFGKPRYKATLLKFENFKSRKRAMFVAFGDARRNGRVCRVLTSMHEYENMVVEQITATRTPGDGNGAVFTVTMKEIDFVTSEEVDAPTPAEVSGATKNATGSQNTEDDSAKRAANNDTAALRLAKAVRGKLPKSLGGK
jgi:hypothetical protein